MAIRARENLIGAWAFLIGILLAVLIGLGAGLSTEGKILTTPLVGILALLGIITGYFVAEKDVRTFLIASVSLVVVTYMWISGLILGGALTGLYIGKIVSSILQSLLALFAPATIIVAIKTVFAIAQS